jgi:FkbM family methyltransferase
MKYYSQYDQDKIVNEHFFHNNKNGIFVDIGAHDGKFLSNTYFFEKYLDWTGICVEPNPEVYQTLIENRKSKCYNIGLNDVPGKVLFQQNSGYTETLSGIVNQFEEEHVQRIENENLEHNLIPNYIEIECDTLNNILEYCNINTIDYMSIDTEGSEYNILKNFDFDKYHVNVLDVEINYFMSEKAQNIFELLKNRFGRIIRVRQDIIFINNDLRYSYETNCT